MNINYILHFFYIFIIMYSKKHIFDYIFYKINLNISIFSNQSSRNPFNRRTPSQILILLILIKITRRLINLSLRWSFLNLLTNTMLKIIRINIAYNTLFLLYTFPSLLHSTLSLTKIIKIFTIIFRNIITFLLIILLKSTLLKSLRLTRFLIWCKRFIFKIVSVFIYTFLYSIWLLWA